MYHAMPLLAKRTGWACRNGHHQSANRKAEKAEPVVVEEEQDLPLRLELRQLVWSRSKCCWPTGDPKKNGFVFCGDAVVPGKPYCLPHCQEAYTTSRDAS